MTALNYIQWTLGVGIVIFILNVLLESNVRGFIEYHGWDTVLTRALSKVSKYRSFWMVLGLVIGAFAMTFLYPRIADNAQPVASSSEAIAAPIRIERDRAIADRDAAMAKVTSLTDENDKLRQRVAALQAKNDSLRFGQAAAPAAQTPSVTLTMQDIGAEISSWKSLSRQLDALNRELNEGDALIAWLEGGNKEDKYSIEHFSRVIIERRQSLNALRNASIAYNDIAAALEQVQIPGGRPPIPGTIFDSLLRSLNDVFAQLPSDQETKEPYIRSFKTGIGVMRDWTIRTKQLADSQAATLANEQPK